ncbi:hypothetical protein [Acidovorax sp. HMWF018]|uniref:hypothetical protein n=1 Tax=Acidovorax sp. HMWF018 TaxID=2056855 RepID=UPI001304B5C5|nr:hypothetical protein [Acidovorax sp. HMWF018]
MNITFHLTTGSDGLNMLPRLMIRAQLSFRNFSGSHRLRHAGYKRLNLLCQDAIAFRLAQALSACS